MPLNVEKWDERIVKDYKHIASTFHDKWRHNRDLMNNEHRGSRFGNLVKEFAGAVRSKLISENFFVRVTSDDPNFSKEAKELTIMANSVARTVDLKGSLDDATEDSLWAASGWLEVGHSLDLHSFDVMRTVLHRGPNSFDPNDFEDDFVQVSEESVRANIGNEADNVVPFNPFEAPTEQSKPQPTLTFDPDSGTPWIKNLSPFFIVLPKETKNFVDADYVTKLVLMSHEELELMVDLKLPDGIVVDKGNYQILIDETPGGEYIDHPVIVAVTFIRRDRNDPSYSGWYLAHVLGHPDIVIKSSVNPYGGMISVFPAKSRAPLKVLSKSWVEDLMPYADNYAKMLQGIFRRMRASLRMQWNFSGGGVDQRDRARINNPDYHGEVKFKNGSAEQFSWIEGPGMTQDHVFALNIITKLAQGEAGQTDIDRGTPIKKITARQTEALLQTSELMMAAIRGPIVKAGNHALLKLVHLLNLFSTQRSHVYTFGPHIVELEPGGNDYTTSYKYRIAVKDFEGPADSESQLLYIQFVEKVFSNPLLSDQYNRTEIADEGRRMFGFGPEALANLQGAGIAGENQGVAPPGQNVLQGEGQGGHPGRLLADQGLPEGGSIPNALSGLRQV